MQRKLFSLSLFLAFKLNILLKLVHNLILISLKENIRHSFPTHFIANLCFILCIVGLAIMRIY